MIELFFATSVNVYKVGIALEEMELPHTYRLIDLSKGEHLDPANIAGAPSGKVPVIRDNAPADGGSAAVVFESGAILQYLADKSGRFLPADPRQRLEVMQWLFWQVGGLGPISGQAWHFHAFAPLLAPDFDNSYAHDRYFKMMSGLWRTLDKRLADRQFIVGEYSIADMACYPWIVYFEPVEGMAAYPNIARWRDEVAERPAVRRFYDNVVTLKTGYAFNERKVTLYDWQGIVENVIVV